MKKPPYSDSLLGIIQLTRWKEYVPFVLPLTVIGALLAAHPHGIALDWRLIAVTLANILAVAYAFMINDIEDAPDDARDPDRAARNPVTNGRVTVRMGYAACRLVAAITLLLYLVAGNWALIIGGATLLLSHLYSWRPVRLKAWPVTDIVSHSLMLSGLLLLAGYFVYDSAPGIVWFVAGGVTLVSVYGQLYNQLRDYDMDVAAGLFNTAIVLGEANTRRAMYAAIGLALGCLLASVVLGAFPVWLGVVVTIAIPATMFIKTTTDMRGGAVVDASGSIQMQSLVVFNAVMVAWLMQFLFAQFFLS